jgi:hypothetical protein
MADKKKKSAAPMKSLRPRARPERVIDLTPDAEEGDQVHIGKKPPRAQKKAKGGPVKYASGGTVRGMGAAKRGGKFTRSC